MNYYETSVNFETDYGEEVTATVRYYPGRPEVRYLRNGDPGYPADPAEVEIFAVQYTDGHPYIESSAEYARWETHVLENPDMYFADCDGK